MSIEFFDPVGDVEKAAARAARTLEGLTRRRVGFVFNQHVSALAFWEVLEKAIEEQHAPARVSRIYKPAHSVTAAQADLERLRAETEYALVGVGA
jgi:hypothetical protein